MSNNTTIQKDTQKCIKQLTRCVFWRRLFMPFSRNAPCFTTYVYYRLIEIIGFKEWDKLDTCITHAWDSARNHSGKMLGLLRVYKKLTVEELNKLKTQEFVSKEEYERLKEKEEEAIKKYKDGKEFRGDIEKILKCWETYQKSFEADKDKFKDFFDHVEKMKQLSIGKSEER